MACPGHRRRRAIQKSVRGALGTLRRTVGNVNDLMFSSSSLASGVSRDLREYMYGDSGATPQSLRRIVALLASEDVQRTIQGTAQGLIAAFFAARQQQPNRPTSGSLSGLGADTEGDALRETLSVVLDKVWPCRRGLLPLPRPARPPADAHRRRGHAGDFRRRPGVLRGVSQRGVTGVPGRVLVDSSACHGARAGGGGGRGARGGGGGGRRGGGEPAAQGDDRDAARPRDLAGGAPARVLVALRRHPGRRRGGGTRAARAAPGGGAGREAERARDAAAVGLGRRDRAARLAPPLRGLGDCRVCRGRRGGARVGRGSARRRAARAKPASLAAGEGGRRRSRSGPGRG